MKTMRTLILVGLAISMAAFSMVPSYAGPWKQSTLKAEAAMKKGDLAKAMAYAHSAREEAGRTFGQESLNASKATELLADVNWAGGKSSEARRLYRKALTMREKLFTARCTACTGLIVKMARLELAEGRLDEAESLFRKVAYPSAERESRWDPSVADALLGVGKIRFMKEDYESAHATLNRALTIYATARKYNATSALKVADVKEMQGDVYKLSGDYSRASKSYLAALHTLEEIGASGGLRAAQTHMRLADNYVRFQKPARALRQFRRALAIQRRENGSSGLLVAATLAQLGALWRQRGNPEAATASYRAAVIALRGCSPVDCPLMASVEQSLAELVPKGKIYAGSSSTERVEEAKDVPSSRDRGTVGPVDDAWEYFPAKRLSESSL